MLKTGSPEIEFAELSGRFPTKKKPFPSGYGRVRRRADPVDNMLAGIVLAE
jgi:hypothetical protein